MPKTYTIAQILATPEGQYVSAEVFAVLTRAQPPKGKGPWTAMLTDSTGSIVGKFWGGNISHWEGKRIKLSGQGMQRKAYQNVPELSAGQKTDVSFAGAPGTAAQEEDAIPGDPVPSKPSGYPFRPEDVAHAPAEKAAATSPIHGATVGGAIARAVEVWTHIRPAGSGVVPDQQDWEDIEDMTRRFVGIQQRIESGESVPF